MGCPSARKRIMLTVDDPVGPSLLISEDGIARWQRVGNPRWNDLHGRPSHLDKLHGPRAAEPLIW